MEFHSGKFKGVKGIGVQVGEYSWGLVNGKSLDLDDLKYVPYTASNSQVQDAIKIIKEKLPNIKIVGE